MQISEINGSYQIETPLNPIGDKNSTIRGHYWITGIFLHLFGKAWSITDKNGKQYWLNTRDTIAWLKNHDLDEQTIKTRGIYFCVIELVLVAKNPTREPNITFAVGSKANDLTNEIAARLNSSIITHSELENLEPAKNDVICLIKEPSSRIDDGLDDEILRYTQKFGKKKVVVILASKIGDYSIHQTSVSVLKNIWYVDKENITRTFLHIWKTSTNLRTGKSTFTDNIDEKIRELKNTIANLQNSNG